MRAASQSRGPLLPGAGHPLVVAQHGARMGTEPGHREQGLKLALQDHPRGDQRGFIDLDRLVPFRRRGTVAFEGRGQLTLEMVRAARARCRSACASATTAAWTCRAGEAPSPASGRREARDPDPRERIGRHRAAEAMPPGVLAGAGLALRRSAGPCSFGHWRGSRRVSLRSSSPVGSRRRQTRARGRGRHAPGGSGAQRPRAGGRSRG